MFYFLQWLFGIEAHEDELSPARYAELEEEEISLAILGIKYVFISKFEDESDNVDDFVASLKESYNSVSFEEILMNKIQKLYEYKSHLEGESIEITEKVFIVD